MIEKLPAKKIGMTSAFDGAGTTVPITLVQPFPVVVTAIKRPETHGYCAVQLGYSQVSPKRLNKPQRGQLDKAGIEDSVRYLYESPVAEEALADIEIGQHLMPSEVVADWGYVKITGISKGKGFAGAMKRWGFKGQCRTHGDPDNRRPMSNNATDPARVFKGSKRPGRMGNHTTTIKGVTVFEYDSDLNLIALTGSVPGHNGSTVFLQLQSTRPVPAVEAEES